MYPVTEKGDRLKFKEIADYIDKAVDGCSEEETIQWINEIIKFVTSYSPLSHNPVCSVQWVALEKVQANEYNPNKVAKNEMHLLYTSISHDGFTQPVVTVYDQEKDAYIIVDGFHRYSTMRQNKDLLKRNHGHLPVVVIEKDINDRMASTIRHNRARGKHQVSGMGDMVFQMLANGWSDAAICEELGMEPAELVRLKHITGFSKLFEDVEHRKAWESTEQIRIRKEYQQSNDD